MANSHGDPRTRTTLTRDKAYVVEGNAADAGPGAPDEAAEDWESRSRIVLTPVAAPSILGLFGFFSATLLVGSHLAGWWGGTTAPLLVFPFALVLGGLAQFLAGMWAYRARDGLATAMHGIWGGFWLAFGLYQLLVATRVLPMVIGTQDVAFGFWFIPMAAITAMGALAAAARNGLVVAVLAPLAAGSVFAAVGYIGGIAWCLTVAGWLFVFSAGFAWYEAGAMMIKAAAGRTILPTGEYRIAANVPGRKPEEPVRYEAGMPGSRVGQ
jgi:uncharacterized protein